MKKIFLSIISIVAVAGGIAAASAFEAHVINVTAHIENALNVSSTELTFGTVFPQEYLEKEFTVSLSDSFKAADRVDDVGYVINQKPKCKAMQPGTEPMYKPVDNATHQCPAGYVEMLSLCPYLSITPKLVEAGDIGVPSYFNGRLLTCSTPNPSYAMGYLAKNEQDIDDTWIVDLKVPPIEGTVGQDWPVGCPTLLEDSKDYGCDLWVEVTGISEKQEAVCGNSIIEEGEECDTNDIFVGQWAYHCNADCTIRWCIEGQIRPCPGNVCLGGSQSCGSNGQWEDCICPTPTPSLSLFEYYNTGDNDVNSVADPKWEAQTFTPQISHRITKVRIKIYRLGLPGIVSVGIRMTDAEGKPSGTDLASGTIDGNTFTADSAGAWYDIDLGNGTILSSGVKYAIVLGNNASGWARWRVAVPSSYEGGTSLTSFDSGNTWAFCTGGDGGYDTLFEEWGI